MTPPSGKLRRRVRLLADACDHFTARPPVLRFTAVTAHAAPLIAVAVGVLLVAHEFLFDGWKHPVAGIAVLVLFGSIMFAQLTHRPDLCRRCQRKMPWGKDRIHAGRAALMATHHASFKIELVIFAAMVLFLIGERGTMPEWLAWASNERVRNVGLNLLMMILMGWLGQAGMTHRIYERSCKRCRGRRRGGGGPDGDGGEPVPLPIELPQRKTA